ncbi:MAG: phytoene desaturase [Saprospiraceae bacterium]|nr:phytoene desaturase [Saprospiraceae bacterium]
MLSKIGIIGSGIAGMTAAIDLASKGHEVCIFEKNDRFGGRGRTFQAQGFTFDMGPSWYWMPEIFEGFFKKHNKSLSDYFELKRLSPSYKMIFKEGILDAPVEMDKVSQIFEEREPGSSLFLKKFLQEAKYKYEVGMKEYVTKPSLSIFEFFDWKIFRSFFKLQMTKSIESVIHKGIKNKHLRAWLNFPVLFLGAKPSETPAMYSLMNYADLELGTWYPMGGMTRLFEAFYQLSLEKGVKYYFNDPVSQISIENQKAKALVCQSGTHYFDYIVSAADYHHTETKLLSEDNRQYSNKYWESRKMAPGALIYYLGIKKKIPGMIHHNLFFDADFQKHAEEIYDLKVWPTEPLFYACMNSYSDHTVAPKDHENLFLLMPIAAGLKDEESTRKSYLDLMIHRMEKHCGESIKEDIVFEKSYCTSDFVNDYNSFKGNAYGLANTLTQTAILKPRVRHRQIKNLFFAGQITHPGPGLPPSMISGEIVSNLIDKSSKTNRNE